MRKNLLLSFIFPVFTIALFDFECNEQKPSANKTDFVKEHKVAMEYGLPVDSFVVEERTIQAGSSLSALIGDLNIDNGNIESILSKASEVFDLRKIKQGNTYKVFHSKDSSKTVNYIVYEQSPVDYVFFNLKDTIHIEKRLKVVETITRTSTGTIESSLWNTIVEKGNNPILSLKLSDVYAWAIDFFGLQKGDQFKVYYQEQFVDGQSIGIDNINAAWFKHMDKEYYAIPFVQDSTIEFFDENGNSLKKAFLKAPLSFSRIGSRFSNSRLHPILKIRRPHHGVDYSAPKGTPVLSIGDGTVLHASYKGEAGNYIKIKHNSIYSTGYMHLSGYGKGIKPGKQVRQGEIIGYVGSTGLSTGSHLDFRVWKNGQNIDPLKLEAPPSDPIRKDKLDFFYQIRDIWTNELNKLSIDSIQVVASK
jgi:murein DD-endopeptidase MepM/ murein hydrolase activator NlpD